MTEMIDRVANAMMKADWDGEREPPPNAKISNYYAMARAAIEAIHEPTEAMIAAAEFEDSPGYGLNRGHSASARTHYRAMIDAVLK